jgi:hypothetical protein
VLKHSIAQLDQYVIPTATFPRGAQATINAMSPDQRYQWKDDRLTCLEDPLALGDALGMDFQENPHRLLFKQFIQMQPLSGLPLSDLSKIVKKFMILHSRGTFKTSAVIVWIITIILNYPNVRICFLTGADQLAKRQLRRVKQMFEKPTPEFLRLFPEFCTESRFNKKENRWEDQPADMGNAHEFTVPCRQSVTFAEPTFAISTAKSVKAGSHFDIIFIDDLVTEANYRSVKLLEKCYQDYIDICPLLDPSGFILMTGTRYSYGDTYERIQEKAKEEEKEVGHTIWHFSIRDCWSYGCKNCEHSSTYHDYSVNIIEPPCTKCACLGFKSNEIKGVYFPATRARDGRSIGHTLEFLEGEKIRLGDEFFSCQYCNSPIAEGSQTFDEILLDKQTLFHLEQIPKYNESYTFVVGDLAYVGQAGRDFTVFYVCRLFEGQIFVFDCIFGNWDSSAIAEETVRVILKHRPAVIYYEKFNGWEAYNTIITARAAQQNIINIPLQWIKGSQAPNAKLARIGSIKAPLKNKRLWLYAGMPGYDQLKTQLLRWPKLGRHDDFCDTVGMIVSAPTSWQTVNPPNAVPVTNWLRALHNHANAVEGNMEYTDTGGGSGLTCG